jgi:predicted ABC-type ATPase
VSSLFDERPVIIALAGPNGAGKTTFFQAHVKQSGLRFINADILASEVDLEPYAAARMAKVLRDSLVEQRESFVFETVFSDPVADKLSFLQEAVGRGYTVVLCFIGISSPDISEQRVAMRVSQGGHDVPTDKLLSRFPRTLANLKAAIRTLPNVLVYDNDDLREPFRQVAAFVNGRQKTLQRPIPAWLESVIAS